MENQLNRALPQGGQFGSVHVQSHIQSDTASRNAPGAPDHAWGTGERAERGVRPASSLPRFPV